MLASYLALAGAFACIVGAIAAGTPKPKVRTLRAAFLIGLLLLLAALGVALSSPHLLSTRYGG